MTPTLASLGMDDGDRLRARRVVKALDHAKATGAEVTPGLLHLDDWGTYHALWERMRAQLVGRGKPVTAFDVTEALRILLEGN